MHFLRAGLCLGTSSAEYLADGLLLSRDQCIPVVVHSAALKCEWLQKSCLTLEGIEGGH